MDVKSNLAEEVAFGMGYIIETISKLKMGFYSILVVFILNIILDVNDRILVLSLRFYYGR